MEIYLYLVILLNFLVDFLLLSGTNRLAGFPAEFGRCALAAVLGALYSGSCMLTGFQFLGNPLWRFVFLCLMAMLSFGLNRSTVKRTGVFLLLNLALGGAAISLGKGDFLSLLLAALVVWLLCQICFGDIGGGRGYVPVTIAYEDKTVSILALQDTGNTLRDPITGEQVLVISGSVAQRLTGLSPEALKRPLETLARRPLPGLRLIPYRAIGQDHAMLLAMRFDHVKIGTKEQKAVVAFAPEGLGQGSMYQALTGGVL